MILGEDFVEFEFDVIIGEWLGMLVNVDLLVFLVGILIEFLFLMDVRMNVFN